MSNSIKEISMLNNKLVVRGKYSLKFSRSIRISPGSLPRKGMLSAKWITTPTKMMITPIIIKNLPIFIGVLLRIFHDEQR